jgi:hypothetical protein
MMAKPGSGSALKPVRIPYTEDEIGKKLHRVNRSIITELRIHITLMRVRMHFQFNVDSDPAPNQSDANLRPLVYRP